MTKALRGLSKADTLLLIEIERYVETGKRADGLHVTDEWIDQCMKFMAGELRSTLEAWAHMGDEHEGSQLTSLAARKLHRAWKKGQPLDALFEELGEALAHAKKVGGC